MFLYSTPPPSTLRVQILLRTTARNHFSPTSTHAEFECDAALLTDIQCALMQKVSRHQYQRFGLDLQVFECVSILNRTVGTLFGKG